MRLYWFLMLFLALAAATPATETTPTPTPTPGLPAPNVTDPQPTYPAFPGLWFDYLPNLVAADTGFEIKLRLGLNSRPPLKVQYLTADGQVHSESTIPNSTTVEDFANGKLAVLTIPVESNPDIAALRLTAGDLTCTLELRAAAADAADLILATLPNRHRPATADHLVAVAQATAATPAAPASEPAAPTWGTLGAHLATQTGRPIVLRHTLRPVQPDRAGLITAPLRPTAADALPAARHILLIAPAALQETLQPLQTWTATQATVVQPIPVSNSRPTGPIPTPPPAPPPATPATAPAVLLPKRSTRLAIYPDATTAQPFHPILGCLAGALVALDNPAFPPADRLVVILPWLDPAFGTDPREYALALDALADHLRARRRAADRPLGDLILIGPFRHPSVPEKRHTMLESIVAERQRAQGFSWPDWQALHNPALWRINPAAEPVAMFAPAPAPTGLALLRERLQPLLNQP